MRTRRSDSALPLGPIARWVVLVGLVGLLGLCYVHMKHKLKIDGDRTRVLEQSVADLDERLNVAHIEIRNLTSRPALERRRQEGFIRMVQVQDARMVRLRTEKAQLRPAGEEILP